MRRYSSLAVLVLVALVAIPLFCGENRPIATSVCSVSKNPNKYSGKLVEVSGNLESDGMHSVAVTVRNCTQFGFAVSTPTDFKGEPDLVKALQTGYPGTLDKTIRGTFVGKFVWNPTAMPKRVLILREVRDVSVSVKSK